MGQIKVEKNAGGIEGLCVIEPAVHGDARGYFMETYNQRDMEAEGLTMNLTWYLFRTTSPALSRVFYVDSISRRSSPRESW